MLSTKELEENLSNYSEQLRQVKDLLVHDPTNDEYKEMATGLEEVLALTRELLGSSRQTEENTALSSNSGFEDSSVVKESDQGEQFSSRTFTIGSKVQAIWSKDGKWYDALIQREVDEGYEVMFSGWGNLELVPEHSVRPISAAVEVEDSLTIAQREAEAAKLAIKRKVLEAATAEIVPKEVPAKLRINADDPEDVKAAKRKKIHSFKSKQRQEILELAQNKKQSVWQKFQDKGKPRKLGFFTGRQKESIFKSPDDLQGKVGVVGSGQGMTEFHKREKFIAGQKSMRDRD